MQSLLFRSQFIFIIPVALLLCLAACRNDPPADYTHEPAADTLTVQPAPSSYHKISELGLLVTVDGGTGSSLRDIEVQVQDTMLPGLISRKLQLDGEITRTHIADLNNDQKKEVYIFNTTSGSGSYGSVVGWQLEGNKLDTIIMDPGEPERDAAYMGHDSFYLQAPYIYRNYPVYRENDPNCCPTGGEKTIKYSLTRKAGHWRLVPVNE